MLGVQKRSEWVASIFAAVEAEWGRNVFSLCTLPATEEIGYAETGKLAGFSLPYLSVDF